MLQIEDHELAAIATKIKAKDLDGDGIITQVLFIFIFNPHLNASVSTVLISH